MDVNIGRTLAVDDDGAAGTLNEDDEGVGCGVAVGMTFGSAFNGEEGDFSGEVGANGLVADTGESCSVPFLSKDQIR